MPVVTPPVPEPAEPGVRELRAPVWTEPLTAEEWVARDPELEPDCGYRYRFDPHELEAIKRCHDNHGFAVVTGVLEPGGSRGSARRCRDGPPAGGDRR